MLCPLFSCNTDISLIHMSGIVVFSLPWPFMVRSLFNTAYVRAQVAGVLISKIVSCFNWMMVSLVVAIGWKS